MANEHEPPPPWICRDALCSVAAVKNAPVFAITVSGCRHCRVQRFSCARYKWTSGCGEGALCAAGTILVRRAARALVLHPVIDPAGALKTGLVSFLCCCADLCHHRSPLVSFLAATDRASLCNSLGRCCVTAQMLRVQGDTVWRWEHQVSSANHDTARKMIVCSRLAFSPWRSNAFAAILSERGLRVMLPWQALLTNGRIFQLPEGNMAQHLSIQGVRYIILHRCARAHVAVPLPSHCVARQSPKCLGVTAVPYSRRRLQIPTRTNRIRRFDLDGKPRG